ncbi:MULTISPECIES: hypothetical protein [Spiroplasma]|uniref:Uncharacterized protein n=1 Tax=Spiroplasma poulsonii TaxID=2138 RepID=A0A2P6FEA0_9MOLU|nr:MULTISPECIES: hypothetical protein [Spiroplasma]KAF0850770.1 hypothetical protein MSROBK_016620 [Spiroplasma poulsonii]PQM31780.1 hypothetical protein SMSRO_SF016330 [Spiroplasma poulsonii]PWF96813.1 hypothetical protein SMSE_22600 [Spiroplasma poulsonii]PWF97387.1 hypothetical protein SMH99_21960 [Spiroplasma poulsonii]UNF61745.1 hypothetical protein MNU24_07490 [Spiroplasma poulsonii]
MTSAGGGMIDPSNHEPDQLINSFTYCQFKLVFSKGFFVPTIVLSKVRCFRDENPNWL